MPKHRSVRIPQPRKYSVALGTALLTAALGVHAAQANPPQSEQVKNVSAQPGAKAAKAEARTAKPAAQKAQKAQAAVKPAAAPKNATPGNAASKNIWAHPSVPAKVTAAQVLELARKQIGVRENSYGGGTKFQKWYASSRRAWETVKRDGGNPRAYINAAWCAMFVSWVGEQAGARHTVGWDAWTIAYARWFKANKRWGYTPKPGAVVFFSWSGSKSLSSIRHVGFVEKDNGNGTITTIEGNTGNGAVERRVRSKSTVVGYGYPQYAG
ncbi:CHAP domain-containing protein [Thermoactinospora rubra]|uniref:CHAP domain-containing protein n=1 Tax=Thermoactinospora rubra TaxID=1088767 RepID=UPI000A100588|nr:CHAP domain-containing protein [Thermoactinospora rubra]